VSHDQHLIEACADRLWLVGDGTVAPYEGDLDDYRRLVLGRETRSNDVREEPASKISRTDQRRAAAEKREELKPLKRRIDAAEKAVARFMAEIATIDSQLATDLFARDPAKATALSKSRAEAAAALAQAEEDWLAASAAYEGGLV
jgi:ATP-binding cassette subfamily F protein 3